ncbi:hypothetical protein [Rhizobium sp.]|uniref:hypothetical protein n=1 Tax=Rhizobium sp. TaxID=391 RepID=UPI003F7D94E1
MITIDDSKSWHMREDAHYNGGKDFFAYLHRCVEHPRLSRYDRYDRSTRGVTSTWRVDGIDRVDFGTAIDALNVAPVLTAEERTVLTTITDEPTDRRKEMIANSDIWNALRDKGFICWEKGRVILSDTGRAALQQEATDEQA